MSDVFVPKSAMVIVAHPDDAEFTVAGTIASWTRQGCDAYYVICTDGNAGSHEPGMTTQRLAEIRRTEQEMACSTVGVKQVIFLGYDDGQLEPTIALRRDLVRLMRKFKPEVVIANDPTRLYSGGNYINHPDHRAAGLATLDAAFPACKMPLLWPELGPAHAVQQVWVRGNDEPNTWVDITETIELKIESLLKHASQLGDWDPSDRLRRWAAEVGEPQGMAYAEAYRVMMIDQPPV